jgi:hypothetical protein
MASKSRSVRNTPSRRVALLNATYAWPSEKILLFRATAIDGSDSPWTLWIVSANALSIGSWTRLYSTPCDWKYEEVLCMIMTWKS